MTLAEWAVHYRQRGWCPIALKSRSKEPVGQWRDFQKNLPDIGTLQTTFADETLNLGLVTGSVSKLAVLDVDGPDGLKSATSLSLSSPVSVLSGKGRHLYYSMQPGISTAVRKFPGLDIRGEGGYIVAPPSIHENGKRYRWTTNFRLPLPVFPVQLLEGRQLPSFQTPAVQNSTDWLGEALSSLSPGNRNATFTRLVGRMKHDNWGVNAMYQALLPHAERVGFESRELLTIINSVNRYEQSSRNNISIWLPKDIKEYEKAKEKNTELVSLPTGFPWIDARTHGIRRGGIFTVAARTNVGKTTFALAVAQTLCQLEKSVLYVSTENRFEGIWDRYFAATCNLPAFKIENNTLDPDQQARLKAFKEKEFPTHKLAVFDATLFDFNTIKDLVSLHQPDVLIFDYFQRMETGDARAIEMAKFARGLRNLANDANIGILVCAQLHDGMTDQRTGKVPPPTLRDVKECKTLADESTTVALLDWDRNLSQDSEIANCLFMLAKNKGPGGSAILKLDRRIPKFLTEESV